MGGLNSILYAAVYFAYGLYGMAAYALLDNTVTLFGICISFLQMLVFLEYTYLMIPSGLVTLALSIRMLPEQIAYLIYSIYSLICVTVQLVNARKLYRLQQGGAKEEPSCE